MYEMICEKVDNMMCRTRKMENWKSLIIMNVRIKMTSAALELGGRGVFLGRREQVGCHLKSLPSWRGAERAVFVWGDSGPSSCWTFFRQHMQETSCRAGRSVPVIY